MDREARQIVAIPQNEADIQPMPLAFYCRGCYEMIAAKQTRKQFVFQCPKCGKSDIAYGTELSIRNFYHIPEGSTMNDRAAKEALKPKREPRPERKGPPKRSFKPRPKR